MEDSIPTIRHAHAINNVMLSAYKRYAAESKREVKFKIYDDMKRPPRIVDVHWFSSDEAVRASRWFWCNGKAAVDPQIAPDVYRWALANESEEHGWRVPRGE